MTNKYLTSETTNAEEIRDYINGIHEEVTSIMFYRGDVSPDFEIPGKYIGSVEHYGFTLRRMQIFENSGTKIIKVYTFNQRNDEAMIFCFILD